tara:strand:+ start:53 stop:178 length:126 start_codon:yes stop_codon:yes gene_type:complete
MYRVPRIEDLAKDKGGYSIFGNVAYMYRCFPDKESLVKKMM